MAEKKSKKKLVVGGCAVVGCLGVVVLLLVVLGGGAAAWFGYIPGFNLSDYGLPAAPDIGALTSDLEEDLGDAVEDGDAGDSGDATDTGADGSGDAGDGTGDTGSVEDPTPDPVEDDGAEDPTPEPVEDDRAEDPTPEPVDERDDGDTSSNGGRPDRGEVTRPDRGDDDDDDDVEVTITHDDPVSMLVVGDKLSISAKTPDVSDCRMRFYWRAGGGSWTKERMSTRGEKHTLSMTVSSDMSPEFEYYLKTSGCNSAKWPSSGYQTVKVF